MATDTRAQKALTLADLCQAIEDHDVSFAQHDGQYELTAREVRHLLDRRAGEEAHLEIPLDALIAQNLNTSEIGRQA